MISLQFKRGTRTELDNLAQRRGLLPGEPFLITDEGRFALATSASTYNAFALDSEGGSGELSPPVTITKSLATTTSWIDTGIVYTDLEPASYLLQLRADDQGVTNQQFSGIMSWYVGTNYGDGTNPSDEILLNAAGSSSNRSLYLRTTRVNSATQLKLQIYTSYVNTLNHNYVFNFRKLT